jgi:hypothetical protein
MLTAVDRIQLVAAETEPVATAFARLLGAETVRRDALHVLGARRTVLRLGTSEVEVLVPNGVGPAADFLAATRGGLFAAGLATPEVERLERVLRAQGVPYAAEHGQLFLAPAALGGFGLRVVVSPAAARQPAGLLRSLYEVTNLVPDYRAATEGAAAIFGLQTSAFVPIRSAEFGYEGTLTLFDPERLDRLEIITPRDPAKTMGRFFARRGPCLYMCYGEAHDTGAVRARLLEHAPAHWSGPRDGALPDNLFIHPPALGGVMIGVSRTTFAWMWSGHPERVKGVEPA